MANQFRYYDTVAHGYTGILTLNSGVLVTDGSGVPSFSTSLPSGVGPQPANPTATASDVAVNGSAATFMRSDGAPAVQKTSSTLFGLAKVDNSTITAAAGVISAVGPVASVANSDGTLTISPTTGAVVASIALGHANTWTAQQILTGTATNDDAATGKVGEFLATSVTGVSLTNNTAANITSRSLTAGDWEVTGAISFAAGAGATVTLGIAAVSLTSADLYTDGKVGRTQCYFTSPVGGRNDIPVGPRRISISTTTTVYLNAFSLFSGGTCSADGEITCRRIR